MDSRTSYLQIVQGVINRLATNSFLLKSWSVTLVSAIVALGVKDSQESFILLAYFPALAFWFLDGYFLSREKKYRDLYERACKSDATEINFSLDTSVSDCFGNSWVRALFSRTILIFHGFIALSILAVVALPR
jgi:hypothetical protein